MFSDELKEITTGAHQGLEKKLIARIKGISNVADYAQLLELIYGFYAPLEDRTTPYLTGRHAENIIADLKHFNRTAVQMPVTEYLPVINSYPSALGSAYVTEGSTLGGTIIAGMISKKLNIAAEKGFSFFYAYGKETKSKWEEFKRKLNSSFSDNEKQEIKQSAIETFSTFNDWITRHEPAVNK